MMIEAIQRLQSDIEELRNQPSVTIIIKTTTGDPADPVDNVSGIIVINEFDTEINMYADGAWRTMASGW